VSAKDTAPRYAGWIEARYRPHKGLWQVRLRYRQGGLKATETEIFVQAASKQEALIVGGERLADARYELGKRLLRSALPAHQRSDLMTLEDFYEDVYLVRRFPQLKPSYRSDVGYLWRAHINRLLGGIALADFVRSGKAIGQEFVDVLAEEGLGRPTIVKVLNVARGILTAAIEDQLLKPEAGVHPFKYVVVPSAPFAEEVEVALELEQWIALAWLAPGRLRHTLWLELVGAEALRQQEVAPLLYSDLLHEDGTPRKTIRLTKAVSGRGRPDPAKGRPGAEISTLKNARQGRRAPELFPAVGELVELVWRDEGCPAVVGTRVFATGGFLGIQDIDNFRDDVWRPAFAWALELGVFEPNAEPKAGPTPLERVRARYGRITPHRGRGVAATAYGYAPGWNEARLLKHVGHMELTTTLDWYFRARDEPRPELEDMPIDEQIRRARRLAVPVLEAQVARLQERIAGYDEELAAARAQRTGTARALAARRRQSGEELKNASHKLAALRGLCSTAADAGARPPKRGRR
jgi:hypothetical protein